MSDETYPIKIVQGSFHDVECECCEKKFEEGEIIHWIHSETWCDVCFERHYVHCITIQGKSDKKINK